MASSPSTMPAAEITERSARRMLGSAAAIWAMAGLPGEEFDEALQEAREVFREQHRRIAERRAG